MFRFSLKSDTKLQSALVVRIFGVVKVDGIDEPFAFGKDEQVVAMQISHKIGIAEEVYALFKNGIVYRYLPGNTLDTSDLNKPDMIRCILLLSPL